MLDLAHSDYGQRGRGGGDLDCLQDLRCSHSGCWTMPALWTLRGRPTDLQAAHQAMLFEGRRSKIRKSKIQKKGGLLKIISKVPANLSVPGLGSWILDPGMDTSCLRWYTVVTFVPLQASQVQNPSSDAHVRLWRRRFHSEFRRTFKIQNPPSGS